MSELRSAVEVFMQTNYSFIMEKLYDRFKVECMRGYELKDLEVDVMVDTIREVFQFGEGNPEMKQFYARLPSNIGQYIDAKYREIDETDEMLISVDSLMEVIKFCVGVGFVEEKKEE